MAKLCLIGIGKQQIKMEELLMTLHHKDQHFSGLNESFV